MNIKIGDVVKYRTPYIAKVYLGVVKEITEVKESLDSKRVGIKEYHVATFDNTVNTFTVYEENIEIVYRDIESEVEQ